MKKITQLLLALALPLFVACGGSSPAVGTWELDTEAMMSSGDMGLPEGMPEEELEKLMAEMAKGMQMTLVLNADGTATSDMTMSMMGQTDSAKMTGSWTLDGEAISITGKEEGKEEEETITGTLKDDTISLSSEEGGPTMVLKKK